MPHPDFPKNTMPALVRKSIRWDNCEGGIATMAQPGEIVRVSYDRPGDSTLSAHFEYGDTVISDYIGVNECVCIVSEAQAKVLQAKYDRELDARIKRNREAREQEELYRDFYGDGGIFEDVDDIDDL
jgi:hypothetical protein